MLTLDDNKQAWFIACLRVNSEDMFNSELLSTHTQSIQKI